MGKEKVDDREALMLQASDGGWCLRPEERWLRGGVYWMGDERGVCGI